MIFNVIGLVIGLMILAAGVYYLMKEKHDPESKKIYSIITAAGVIIVLAMLVKMFLL